MMDLMPLADAHMEAWKEWFTHPSPFQPNYESPGPKRPARLNTMTNSPFFAQEILDMSSPIFRKAVKTDARLRMALMGPSGAGKTLTALHLAQGLDTGPIALIDTERGSASKYADPFDFDVLELDSFHPERYIEAIHAAEQGGYGVLIIDSLSHAWTGKGGALELVDEAAKKMKSSNTFAAWRDVTPLHNRLLDALLGTDLHVVATLRSKMEYVQDRDEKGRTLIRKVGLQAVQRDGIEYEFDVVGEMDPDHTLTITKSRCPALADRVFPCPNGQVSELLKEWLQGVPWETLLQQETDVLTALMNHPVFSEAERQSAWDWIQQEAHRNLNSLTQLKAKLWRDIKTRTQAPHPQEPKPPGNGKREGPVPPPQNRESSVRPELLAKIQAYESKRYPNPAERDSERQHHLGHTDLEPAPDERLTEYLNHLVDRTQVTIST